MSDAGAPPDIPAPPGQQDDVYAIDPAYALIFTYTWVSVAAAAIVYRSPKLYRRFRTAWKRDGVQAWGVYEDLAPMGVEEEKEALINGTAMKRTDSVRWASVPAPVRVLRAVEALFMNIFGWDIKYVKLSVGQLFLLLGFTLTLLLCLTQNSELVLNSNRAGFMVLSLIPPVFLLSTKNSLLAFLLSVGYEKLNFLHRWAGRMMLVLAVVHGGLWINNRIVSDMAYLIWTEDKERRGLATISTLFLIVLTSIRPIRRLAWQFFFASHVALYVAFFVCLNYHTPYAVPWIFPALAFYGWDLAVRLLRFRMKDANVLPVDDQMTLIHIPDANGGWRGGQHVRLRIFAGTQAFQAHPLTILNSPAPRSDPTRTQGMLLGARVNGDWTLALNKLGKTRAWVMLDGPYGGVNMSPKERVLLIAGGCGVTFTLGVLDELITGVENGDRRLREIDWVWYIRSYDCVGWFVAQLQSLALRAHAMPFLDLRVRIFLTCPCGDPPELLASIPDCVVNTDKPKIEALLEPLLDFEVEDGEGRKPSMGGGVGVAACGPEMLVRHAQNAVAAISPARAARCGGVEVHAERFSM
ncbi:hypothetical protein CALCODRAFT_504005 [Calocera cornea HHB12733]|uniref:FAD-binding FR-type domain-containing protein n=1 Tax=Calocera cornea HHB12733 TaxID=1353952 RepID=A0A165CMN3_9BASI|nr:hypothetical protein CALCODRAFT_504005 [Calocera cornea HHB12733]